MRAFKKHYVINILAFCFLSAMILPAEGFAGNKNGQLFYVDAAHGDDNNSGLTTARAWKTLVKLNATTFLPGSNILFKRG